MRGAVALSLETELINGFNIFKSVAKVSETEGNTIHVALIWLVLDDFHSCSFPSVLYDSLLDEVSFHKIFVLSKSVLDSLGLNFQSS